MEGQILELQSTALIRLETEERRKSFLLSEVGDTAFRVPQGRNSRQSNAEKKILVLGRIARVASFPSEFIWSENKCVGSNCALQQ